MNDSDYFTMKELGLVFGLTSHQIGKALKQLGLRTDDGKPSPAAFQKRLCTQRWANDGQNYCWAWHRDKVTALLDQNGFRPTPPRRPSSPSASDAPNP